MLINQFATFLSTLEFQINVAPWLFIFCLLSHQHAVIRRKYAYQILKITKVKLKKSRFWSFKDRKIPILWLKINQSVFHCSISINRYFKSLLNLLNYVNPWKNLPNAMFIRRKHVYYPWGFSPSTCLLGAPRLFRTLE